MSHSVTKKRENHRKVAEYSNTRAYSETGPQSTRNSHLDAAALDYTPLEAMFSKVKQSVRRAEARTGTRLYDAVGEALRHVTPQDILGWFRHAGLCATPG